MIDNISEGIEHNQDISRAEIDMKRYLTQDKISYWLGRDSLYVFNNKKDDVLPYIQKDKECTLREKAAQVMAKNTINTGHGIDHHDRTKELSTMIAIVQGFEYQDVQKIRYASQIHDISKNLKKGGKGHDWEKTVKISKNIMNDSGIEEDVVDEVVSIVLDHDKDDPSERGRLGNIVYEADTLELTYLPRCFQFATAVNAMKPGTYTMMQGLIDDYTRYHILVSRPKTYLGKELFEKGKSWAMPALERLEETMVSNEINPYFDFLNLDWRSNIQDAPEFLNEILGDYLKQVPRYEIDLVNDL